MSGTPQRGRRRPIATATASSYSATPRREPKKRASPLEASPRGASLLTPEPAQKRRTMRGGDGGGSHSSGLHVSVPPETDQENDIGGGDSSAGTVNTPGTNTAHLLLQLRRDCLEQQKRQQQQQQQGGEQQRQQQKQQHPPKEQQQQKQQQQHQYPKPPLADRSAISFGVRGAGGPLRGSEGTETSPGDAAAGAFAVLDQRMNQTSGSGGRPRTGRGSGAAVASSSSAIGGNRQGQCDWTSVKKAATKAAATATATEADVTGQAAANAARTRIAGKKRRLALQVVGSGTAGAGPATERVFTGRHVNLTNANLRGLVKLGRSENEGCTCKKSQCLKLYCQCFARQSMCTQACRCENCHNSAQHDVERQAAVKELLCRSPNAFGAKFTTEVHATAGGTTASSAVVHSTGCGCSKSACLKRYCECFSLGIACSNKCRCRDCKNKVAAGRARTGPGIGAGGGDLGACTVDTMSSTTPRPPTTAVRTSDMSRAGTGDVPEISAKRPRTTVMERHPQDRAGTEVEGCSVFPTASELSFRTPWACSPDA